MAFHPNADQLARLVQMLHDQVEYVVIVNNGDGSAFPPELCAQDGVYVKHLHSNLGVAAALNVGFRYAQNMGADFVLCLDQDSEPCSDMVNRLLSAYEKLRECGQAVAAIGAQAVDLRTGRIAPYVAPVAWSRRQITPLANQTVAVDHLITSGSLVPVTSWFQIGPYLEALFIDYVDIEWCLRARHQGWSVYGVEGATFGHALGDRVIHFFGLQLPWHRPLRHYYLFRNAVYMLKLPYPTFSWKVQEAWYLFKKAPLF